MLLLLIFRFLLLLLLLFLLLLLLLLIECQRYSSGLPCNGAVGIGGVWRRAGRVFLAFLINVNRLNGGTAPRLLLCCCAAVLLCCCAAVLL